MSHVIGSRFMAGFHIQRFHRNKKTGETIATPLDRWLICLTKTHCVQSNVLKKVVESIICAVENKALRGTRRVSTLSLHWHGFLAWTFCWNYNCFTVNCLSVCCKHWKCEVHVYWEEKCQHNSYKTARYFGYSMREKMQQGKTEWQMHSSKIR